MKTLILLLILGPPERANIQGYGECMAQQIVGTNRYVVVESNPVKFIHWMNLVRSFYNLPLVRYDQNLTNWAALNNREQAIKGMGHYIFGPAKAQNAAWGPYHTIGPNWLNSASHRAILLDPTITRMGIAGLGSYWTMNVR